jgi:predicted transcriptional regulator of viral defense system
MHRETAEKRGLEKIKQLGGVVRTTKAINAGIHPRTLYALRDSGALTQISRGIYQLTEFSDISNPDLVAVAARAPRAIICLISALSFHNLTTQVPHEVSIAIVRGSRAPRIHYPPIAVHQFSPATFQTGIEEHTKDGVTVKVYCAEKTLADCFKFRNKIGQDVVVEALKLYRSNRKIKVSELMKYAAICRVEHVMKPYLSAIL